MAFNIKVMHPFKFSLLTILFYLKKKKKTLKQDGDHDLIPDLSPSPFRVDFLTLTQPLYPIKSKIFHPIFIPNFMEDLGLKLKIHYKWLIFKNYFIVLFAFQ